MNHLTLTEIPNFSLQIEIPLINKLLENQYLCNEHSSDFSSTGLRSLNTKLNRIPII